MTLGNGIDVNLVQILNKPTGNAFIARTRGGIVLPSFDDLDDPKRYFSSSEISKLSETANFAHMGYGEINGKNVARALHDLMESASEGHVVVGQFNLARQVYFIAHNGSLGAVVQFLHDNAQVANDPSDMYVHPISLKETLEGKPGTENIGGWLKVGNPNYLVLADSGMYDGLKDFLGVAPDAKAVELSYKNPI